MATTFFGVNLQQLGSGIADAINYWGAAMRDVLPKGMQQRLSVGQEQLIVRMDGEQLALEQNVNGNIETLATFPHAGGLVDGEAITLVKKTLNQDNELILQVADETVLSKPVGFPAAVADNLRQTLLYEMDKHTPFAKEDVLFDVVVEHRQAASIQARLYLLHRQQVAPILTAFAQAKIRFDRICPRSAASVNLLPPSLRRKRPILPGKRNLFLGLVWLLLLALAFAAPLYFKRDTAIQLEAQMAVLQTQAMGESELWERRDAEESNILAFVDAYPMPFSQMYEELSKILPDDTWVNNLVYKDGRITIRGEGKETTQLIGRLNASPLFKNARIMSPIVKSKLNVDKETYHIAFDVVSSEGGQGDDQ